MLRRTPKFDDAVHRPRHGRTASRIREGYIRSAYHDADEKLGIARALMGGNPTTFAGSDHGFAPQWYAVNASKVLNQATVGGVSLHVGGAGTSNCSAIVSRRRRAAGARSRADEHRQGLLGRRDDPDLHQPDRDPGTAHPTCPTYEEARTAIRNAFQSLTDPANPGKQVVLRS